MLPILLALALQASPAPAESSAASKAELDAAVGAVLQGRGAAAREKLSALSEENLSEKHRGLRNCALSRLNPEGAAPVGSEGETSPFVRDLLALYRTYWRAAALDEAARPAAEQGLRSGLARLLGRPEFAGVGDAEPLIAERLKAEGLFSQLGRTGVFSDLMIWRSRTERVEEVALPEGVERTSVHYLDGWISRGWSTYFTCDQIGTGGWATKAGLFVVVPAYASLTDEAFRVNFLAHESQHYADLRRFGDLPSWRLEFRAKLVEVGFADATLEKVLRRFNASQGDNEADPHSFANARVLLALQRRLGATSLAELLAAPAARLREAAIAELRDDTKRLTQRPPS